MKKHSEESYIVPPSHKFVFHPVVKDFPPMARHRLDQMRAHMAEDGFNSLVLIWTGLVIDGYHRITVAKELGLPIRCLNVDGTEEEAIRKAWRMNDDRRHWLKGEAQIAAGKLLVRLKNLGASDRPPKGGQTDKNGSKYETAAIVAEQTGIPQRTVERAARVAEDGSAKLQEAVMGGEIAVTDAAAITDESKSVQNEAVSMVAAGEAPTARAAVEKIHQQAAQPKNGRKKLTPGQKRAQAAIEKRTPPVFDYKKFQQAFDTVVRMAADHARLHKDMNAQEYIDFHFHMGQAANIWHEWSSKRKPK